ncbi:MAG: thioredoxin family protein [Proteobacteria bacterium]|nr:thioredoxin family protein [Pseudomonadota bacterium]MCP4915510.1 thioredoxin family protein [Pseudomonadota bacterium]
MLILSSTLALAAFPDPWDVPTTLDVETISHGESVDPIKHLAEGKFTVLDIGAGWCTPCHEAAGVLRDYMADHDDVAVRAVSLGDGPMSDYPASELLSGREMIPFLVVYSPQGSVIYEGHRVKRALRRIERAR